MTADRKPKKRGRVVYVWIVGVALLAVAVASTADRPQDLPTTVRDPSVVARGQELYSATCASCHGADLEGTDTGPPFLDPIYAPNHHGDAAFQRATALGVQPHHWGFGAMPAQPEIDQEEVDAIVAFVRSEQEAAGIFVDPTH